MRSFLSIARQALIASTLLIVPAGTVMAKSVVLVPGQVVGRSEIPDDWKVSETDRGLEFASPDEEVMIWVEVFKPSHVATVKGEHAAYFKEQGVKITGESVRNESVKDGLRTIVEEIPATYKGDPTILAYQVYGADASPKQILLMTYWASPGGDTAYGNQVKSILSSTKFTLQ